jgi:hypothetical protein
MPHLAAIPFLLERSHDVIGREITSTSETIHGLLRLDGARLVVQWRLERTTERIGSEIRSDREVEPVREVVLPLESVAGAQLRTSIWPWIRRARLVLTAADLRAFEPIAGAAGLEVDHPAELTLFVRRADLAIAGEFVGELELAIAERGVALAEGGASPTLPSARTSD